MRAIQIKNTQVKCNFCFEWMNLNTEVKLNINICDICFNSGCASHNLRAISSQGQIYKVYIIKQNSSIASNQCIKTLPNEVDELQQQKKSCQTDCGSQLKTEFLQQIDHYRNFQLNDILSKWQTITQFIKEKQRFSIQQINFLKNLCQLKTQNLRTFHQELKNQILIIQQNKNLNLSENNSELSVETSLNTEILQLTNNQNKQSFKAINNVLDNQIGYFSSQQLYENFTGLCNNYQINIKSPKNRQILGQKDLNIPNLSLNNISLNKINKITPKRLKTQTLDAQFQNDQSFFTKSQISNNKSNSFKYLRSNSKLTSLDRFQQGIKKQQLTKYKSAKAKAIKYLETNYQSSSLTRLMLSLVLQAYSNTSQLGKSLQLISFNINHTDLRCYLQMFEWNEIQLIKLVKTKLSDEQFKILINFIQEKKTKTKVLVLTSNKLTQKSIQYLNQNQIQTGKIASKNLKQDKLSVNQARNIQFIYEKQINKL